VTANTSGHDSPYPTKPLAAARIMTPSKTTATHSGRGGLQLFTFTDERLTKKRAPARRGTGQGLPVRAAGQGRKATRWEGTHGLQIWIPPGSATSLSNLACRHSRHEA
jgi:hypothetical protein